MTESGKRSRGTSAFFLAVWVALLGLNIYRAFDTGGFPLLYVLLTLLSAGMVGYNLSKLTEK